MAEILRYILGRFPIIEEMLPKLWILEMTMKIMDLIKVIRRLKYGTVTDTVKLVELFLYSK